MLIKAYSGLNRFTIGSILVFVLAACSSTSPDTDGTGTATPPADDFAKVGQQLDKADQRVAAAVQVARENADRPEIVKAETGVALSFLPKPDAQALDYVRNRVARNNAEEYRRAEEAGRKLLAVINANWDKAAQDAAKNKTALDNANKEIARLKSEVEQVRTEGVRNAFAVAAGICFLAALAMALLGQYVRAGAAFAIGGAIGSLPFVFNSPYFLPAVGFLIFAGAVLVWFRFRKPAPCPAPADNVLEKENPNP
jgi:VIT1/CCC1 family predicted Fe2+/Mn2+ transporter